MSKTTSLALLERFAPNAVSERREKVSVLATTVSVAWPEPVQRAFGLLATVNTMRTLPLSVVEKAYLDAVVAMVDWEKFDSVIAGSPVDGALFLEADFLRASLGIDIGASLYSESELREALITDFDDFSRERFLVTCREIMKGMFSTSYCSVLLLLLRSPALLTSDLSKREETMLIMAAVFALAAVFNRLDQEQQTELLRNYFYRGCVMGLPFFEVFKQNLLSSIGFFDYIGALGMYIQGIEENIEDVSSNGLLFGKMFVDYHDKKSKNVISSPVAFINSLKLNLPLYSVNFLAENLALAEQLKTANLVTWEEVEKAHQQSDESKITEDLTKLFEYFLIQADWKKFADYFRQKHQVASLKGFFKRCQMGLDIRQSTVVERMSLFTDFLKNEGILKPDQEILIFHESDGQFHWNPEEEPDGSLRGK